jgi:hypothetical protein
MAMLIVSSSGQFAVNSLQCIEWGFVDTVVEYTLYREILHLKE